MQSKPSKGKKIYTRSRWGKERSEFVLSALCTSPMQVQIKTLTGINFTVTILATETVFDLKQKINQAKGYPISEQRLIHSGRVLKDAQVLDFLHEGNFIVMIQRKNYETESVRKRFEKTWGLISFLPRSRCRTSIPLNLRAWLRFLCYIMCVKTECTFLMT